MDGDSPNIINGVDLYDPRCPYCRRRKSAHHVTYGDAVRELAPHGQWYLLVHYPSYRCPSRRDLLNQRPLWTKR